jgi:hypothetical protein
LRRFQALAAYPEQRAARRLAKLHADLASSLATIRKHHADGSPSRINLEAQYANWRKAYYGRDGYTARKHYGGVWQDVAAMGGYTSPRDREYYCDAFPDGWREHEGTRSQCPGWYVDSHCSETVKGVALQLPARDGTPRYVPALTWSDREGVSLRPLDWHEELEDALSAANSWAESASEDEREYSHAWTAGAEANYLDERLAEMRAEMLEAVKLAKGLPIVRRRLLEDYASRREENRADVETKWQAVPSHLEGAFHEGRGVTTDKPRQLWRAATCA